MAQKSFEEQIKEYDKRRDMHYYVYFSGATHTYQVKTIQFKKKSELKLEYFKKQKYFSTYLAAQQVADKLNVKDTDIGHLFGKAASEFENKLYEILEMDGITAVQKRAIEAAKENVIVLAHLLNNEQC